MNTEEYIIQNKGNLLVFDLAEKLKVVGTYHALNQKDKEELERLVDTSDFIACEGWTSDVDEPEGIPIPFARALKYHKKMNVYTCNYLDSLYTDWFLRLANKNIKKSNERILELTGVARDLKEKEFEFCRKLAKEKNKEFYTVDLPFHDMLAYLLNQSKSEKIRQMLGRDNGTFEKRWRELRKLRERTMLERIAEREGPISQLKRQGLFSTGYSHAVNYLEGQHSELLQ
jgi:hypothetical protein